MQNNESKESLDDFWKILSESDDGSGGEMDFIFKSRGGGRPLDGGSEEARRTDAEKPSGAVSCRTTASVGGMDETGEFLGDEGIRKDDGGECVATSSNAEDRVVPEGCSNRKSVDEMDFLWEDEDEDDEFIMRGTSSVSGVKRGEVCDGVENKEVSREEEERICETVAEQPQMVCEEHPDENAVNTLSGESGMKTVLPEAVESTGEMCPREPGSDGGGLRQRPVCKFVNGKVIGVVSRLQRRFNMQGEATENQVSMMQWYCMEYTLPEIKPSKFVSQLDTCGDERYSDVYRLVQLKDPHVSSVAEIVWSEEPRYAQRDICIKIDSSRINRFIGLCFRNRDEALEYAVSNDLWALGLLLLGRDRSVGTKFLETFCSPPYVPFVSAALGLPAGRFEVKDDWRRYFREVMSIGQAEVVDEFILQLSRRSIADTLFVVVSCHMLKVVDISRYLWMFSRNFEALRVLCYVEYVTQGIKDLDLLKYEFVSAGIEFERGKAEEYFQTNRKYFRKELHESLRGVFETKWSFGLKNVFDFGLRKILDVEEVDEKKDGGVERSERGDGETSTVGTRVPVSRLNFKMKTAAKTVPGESRDGRPLDEKGEERSVEGKKMYSLSGNEAMLRHEEIEQSGVETSMEASRAQGGRREQERLYSNDQQSKSLADLLNEDRGERETRSEDDASLFLSRFSEEEPKETEKPQRSSSFFGFLNVFKKEPVHKVKIDAGDDFRYDPVSGRWISKTTSGGGTGSSPVLKPREIPKPAAGGSRGSTYEVDDKETSMYANRKSVESRGIPGVLNKKD